VLIRTAEGQDVLPESLIDAKYRRCAHDFQHAAKSVAVPERIEGSHRIWSVDEFIDVGAELRWEIEQPLHEIWCGSHVASGSRE